MKARGLGGRGLQRAVDQPGQRFELEGFLQRGTIAIFFRKPRGAVAGREDERPIACIDQFGDGGDHLAVDVDVENGQIEFCALRQSDRLIDLAGLGGDAIAEFLEHVGDHHPDHDLVFYKEDRTARRPRRGHDDVLARPGSEDRK